MAKRTLIDKFLLILGLVCLLGATVITIAYGMTIGNAMAYLAGAVLAALGLWFRKMPRLWQRLIRWGACAGGALFVVVFLIILAHGRDTVDYREDCVMVLGCGVRGEQVLPTMQARLDRCLDYLAKNPGVPVVVTGGQGNKERITEALAMRRYLESKGIPAGQIISEDRASDTKENIKFSKVLLDSIFHGEPYTVACITSDFHLYRTGLIVAPTGLDVRYMGSGVKWYLRPSTWSREVLSVIKYWIFK